MQKGDNRSTERQGDDHSEDGSGNMTHQLRDQSQAYRIFKSNKELPKGNQAISNMPIEAGLLFEQALEQTRMAIALSDPNAPDNPLVFVNKAFEVLTGYDRRECVGRNCRFLQTENTSESELDRLRRAMANEDTVVVDLENRRKDGSIFVNALHVGPIYNEEGRLTHFYGSQWDISELVQKRSEVVRSAAVTRELEHRIGNLFTVISSIVRLSGRGEDDVQTAINKANERILALARAHSVSVRRPGSSADRARLQDLVETIVSPYRLSAAGRIVLGGNPVELPPTAVTPLGLCLHELATNAVKYGALKRGNGRVTIEWQVVDDELHMTWDEEGGDPVTEPRDGTGTGTRILEGVMASVDASISFHWREQGLRATIAMPLTETVLDMDGPPTE